MKDLQVTVVPDGNGRPLRLIVETTVETPISFYTLVDTVPFIPMDATVWPEIRRAWPDIKPGDRVRVTVDRIPEASWQTPK